MAPTKNIEAYTLYLKGRYHFNKYTESGLRKALDFFQQALLRDPGFARAYAGIADSGATSRTTGSLPRTRIRGRRPRPSGRLQRDPNLAEAMISIGKVLCWHEWEFAEAERQMRRAVEVSPNNADGALHPWHGPSARRPARRGIEEIRKALVLDPLYAHLSSWLARFSCTSGDYPSAIAQGEKTLEIEEDDVRSFVFVGSAHLALGDPGGGARHGTSGARASTIGPVVRRMIVRALAALGRADEAQEILSRLESESRQHYVRAEYLAMGYAAIGDFDHAFESLERAFQARSGGLIYLHLDPGYAPLRNDPRFRRAGGADRADVGDTAPASQPPSMASFQRRARRPAPRPRASRRCR